MRRAHGYAVYTFPDTRPIEYDTVACGHCRRAIFTKPGSASTVYLIVDRRTNAWREEPGAFCRVCMSPVCLACDAHGRCTPFERRLEEAEARDRLRRQVCA